MSVEKNVKTRMLIWKNVKYIGLWGPILEHWSSIESSYYIWANASSLSSHVPRNGVTDPGRLGRVAVNLIRNRDTFEVRSSAEHCGGAVLIVHDTFARALARSSHHQRPPSWLLNWCLPRQHTFYGLQRRQGRNREAWIAEMRIV